MGSGKYCYDIFYLYQDSPWRRRALSDMQGRNPDGFLLYGLDHFAREGFRFQHNLNNAASGNLWVRFNRLWTMIGGYGGDFGSVWNSRKDLNQSKVIISTTDRVGIPLVLFKLAGVIRRPVVYVSIGLPVRLGKLQNPYMINLYKKSLLNAERIVCYGFEEAELICRWLERKAKMVRFIPFGVDTEVFKPQADRKPEVDVISVGSDPNRDFDLLYGLGERRKELSIQLITTPRIKAMLRPPPSNLSILDNVSPRELPQHLANARCVVLPVKENCYSGATTTLMQAMAMAKPVVVSRVGAIREGYYLKDGENCKLVTPGDMVQLESAVMEVLLDDHVQTRLGIEARKTVMENLSWQKFTEKLKSIVRELSDTHK